MTTSFFIPGFEPAKAKEIFATIIKTNDAKGTKPTGRKVFRLEFMHDGKDLAAEVGKPHPHYPEHPNSLVQLIIEQGSPQLYYVEALPQPFLVGLHDTYHCTLFED